MKKYKCPNCGEETITSLKKFFLLSPRGYPRCKQCDKKYGLSNRLYLVVLPLAFAWIISLAHCHSSVTYVLSTIVFYLASSLYGYIFIPLESKEDKNSY